MYMGIEYTHIHAKSHPRQKFFFESACMSLHCLSQVSEYLHVYVHVRVYIETQKD